MDECVSPGAAGGLPSDPESQAGDCPVCGQRGRKVGRKTLDHLLTDAARLRLEAAATYRFCASPDCDVVYFAPNGAPFLQGDLTVRVGLKAKEPPVPLCYCFGYTEADIARDLATKGTTSIPTDITARIKAGECACEVRNPQGSCCLGNVAMAVKRLQSRQRQALPAELRPSPTAEAAE